ncbi:hypothetical protein KR009_001713, partial [Drosophila setifemur]
KNRIINQNSVRASFNINSSVENSNHGNIIKEPFMTKKSGSNSFDQLNCLISTPSATRFGSNPFCCELSPIDGMQLDGFGIITESKQNNVHLDSIVQKKVCFENSSQSSNANVNSAKRQLISSMDQLDFAPRDPLVLHPGKWRKSLSYWRRTHGAESNFNESIKELVRTVHKTIIDRPTGTRKSVNINKFNKICLDFKSETLKYCKQNEPLSFNAEFSQSKLHNAAKIGEGAYGEVFRYITNNLKSDSTNTDMVLKIIPIEGSIEVNGELHKSYDQILPEIIISTKMSSLRASKESSTEGFAKLHQVSLVIGNYPQHLIKLWERYDDEKGSENDHPGIFGDNQLFIVLELEFAGSDMMNYKFTNAEQSYYALLQIILTLAVGEVECQFEHRDLHWGNILIKKTNKKQICFKLSNNNLTVYTKGVNVTIIDYTLSRITIDECCHFNDLSNDEELFSATGDYQYDIYRKMRVQLQNNWASYAPKTNVLWLSYVIAKLIENINYKSGNTKIHRIHIQKLKELHGILPTFKSAAHCAKHIFNLR